jgi:nicotinamide-nucleotide amidase
VVHGSPAELVEDNHLFDWSALMDEINETAEAIARLLVSRHESVAVSESSAGGLIAAALIGVAGASAYFKGGAVVYTGDQIQRLVGLTPEQLAATNPSTAPRAAAVAEGVLRHLDSTWAIAETGAAGPTGNRYGNAAGHAALAVAGPVQRSQVIETGNSDRRQNMQAFALAALRLLRDAIEQR